MTISRNSATSASEMSISATRSVDKGRQSLCQRCDQKEVCLRQHDSGWGRKVDFNLISHASPSCVLRKAYLAVHSSEFILFCSSLKVGIQAAFERRPIKLHCPKTDRSAQ